MLSDQLIRQRLRRTLEGRLDRPNDIVLSPPPEDVQIQPASLDLRLGRGFHVQREGEDGQWHEDTNAHADHFLLRRGDFLLATTLEYIELPADLVARVEGKSSLGRRGLMVHVTAGFIDPGFKGNITLEMMNLSPRPIALKIGMRICQLSFEKVDGRVERPYGHPALKSKYQGQLGVTESRAHQDRGR